jgi:hypothetical protein
MCNGTACHYFGYMCRNRCPGCPQCRHAGTRVERVEAFLKSDRSHLLMTDRLVPEGNGWTCRGPA